MEKQEKVTYSQREVAKRTSEVTGYTVKDIEEILSAVEDVVNDMILEADESSYIQVFPLTGIKIKSQFHGKEMHSHPKNPNGCVVPEGIRMSAALTKDFKEKRSKEYREENGIVVKSY